MDILRRAGGVQRSKTRKEVIIEKNRISIPPVQLKRAILNFNIDRYLNKENQK
jgi:hypothetical protein